MNYPGQGRRAWKEPALAKFLGEEDCRSKDSIAKSGTLCQIQITADASGALIVRTNNYDLVRLHWILVIQPSVKLLDKGMPPRCCTVFSMQHKLVERLRVEPLRRKSLTLSSSLPLITPFACVLGFGSNS